MPEKEDQGQSSPLATLGAIAALVIAALTGTFYLAGWVERKVVLGRYGLTVDHFSESLQSTLARGYLPVLITFVVIGAILGVAWFFVFRGKKIPAETSPFLAWLRGWIDSIYLWNLNFASAFAILVLGWLAGTFNGNYIAYAVSETIASDCARDCFVYATPERHVVGMLLAEDSTHMAIYTADGVTLLANGDVGAIFPYRPGMRLPPLSPAPAVTPAPSRTAPNSR